MHLMFPTRSRTGSQFVVDLTNSIKSSHCSGTFAGVNGYRQNTRETAQQKETFRTSFLKGEAIQHVKDNNIKRMKYEDPGKDTFALEIATHFPSCLFIASHREIDKTINSHYNIKKWGHAIEDVLYQYSSCLQIYEHLHRLGRIFLIDVDNPRFFSLDALCNFLGGTPSPRTEEIVQNWKPINDLKYQLTKGGATYDPERITAHPATERLRDTHFWIEEAENRYHRLVLLTNKVADNSF